MIATVLVILTRVIFRVKYVACCALVEAVLFWIISPTSAIYQGKLKIKVALTYNINLHQKNPQVKSLAKLSQSLVNVLWIEVMVSQAVSNNKS